MRFFNNRPIRLIELFAGIGSQAKALKNIGVEFEHWRVCESDKYAFKKAQETGKIVNLSCAIGDTEIDGKPYAEIVEEARAYIKSVGGFEKFAEWGLI